ncbi:MAG: cadherin-like beta sandwich domain-containing protein [Gammaproteobacteria bacterium]|nr:cadherin-like beta sandwich domain-containing protein [Gammaproteobacteria bacterium]
MVGLIAPLDLGVDRIITSYKRGSIRGERNVGGLIGRGFGIRNSYWDTTTGGIAGDDDGIGKTAVELQTPTEAGSTATEIYYGWSSKNWDFGSAEQYPILKSTLNTLLPFQRIGLLRLDLQGDLILLPSFRTNVFNYRVIATNLSQLQLIPTAVSVNANIVVSSADGFSTSVVSGTTSTDVPLNTNGATTVAVEVSADNKNTVQYMLDVNNNNFNEGDRMILGHPHQVANEEVLTYEWTQESGIDLLSGVATDQALLDIKLPENLIGINSTATTAVFRLEISRGSTVVQSTDLLVTITKIDNSTIRLTSPPTLQALTLTAPQIDLSADSDGVGSLDVNSYRWQQRSGIGADWAEIEGETEATYRLPDDVPRYGEYQVRFSYTDGQGYSKSLVSDVIIVATDIDKDDDGLIEISNLQELNAIRYQPDGSGYRVDKDAAKSTEGCADGGCKGYELTRDLDFNDDESYRVGSGWQPIGTDRSPFNGIFHAHNNTISNLRINTAYARNVGLFGVTGNEAEIDGIGLLNVDIIGSDSVGGLVGHKIGGTVRNSYVTGRVAGRGLYDVGGLVGWHQGGTITDSYTSSTVVATGTNSGGLVGDNDSAVITNSYTLGRVVANENSGGLVGRNTGTVTRSHATGTVEGGGAVGGLVGHNRGIITNSHTANAVTGGADVGGLAGWSSGDITNSYAIGAVAGNNTVGGFIGHNLRGTITNSYARSDVSGVNQYIGGFAGWNGAGTIINSYARGDVSGQEDVGGLVGVNNSPAGRVGKSYAVGRVVGMGDVGGLVGENRDGTITKSYWNITNNPTTTSTGGTPKTIVELQTPTAAGSTTTEIYYDWQSDDWDFASPTRYPLLRHAVGADKAYPACGTTPTCGTLLSGQLPPVGLLGLTLSAGATLSPRFDVAIYNYHVNAKADAEFLRIQFTARDADATIKISTDGGFVADNASSDTRISLNADRATMITITVMAEYGITSEYKLYVNRMPKIVPIGPDTSVVIKEGKEHVIDVAVSDADISDVLILSLGAVSGSQDVVELVTTNVTVSANGSPERAPQSLGIKGLKADSTTLALTVRDEHEASATVLLTVTVEANEAPILTIKSLPSETISLGSTASLVVSVSDANFDVNDGVALEVVSSTSTVLVEPAGIVDIRGDTDKTFVLTGVQAGTAMISITATDGDGASTQTTFVLFIDAETTGTVSINSEDTWRLQATAEAEDANGIAEIKYQWYRREVGVTRLTKLVGETSRTYTIADDHVSRVAGTVYEISVSVTDRINRRSVLSAQHTVANETPTIGTLAPKEVEEGDTIDASEAVSDANHDDLNYQWQITDKADGSTVPADDSRLFVVPTDLVKPPAETTTLTLMLTVSDGRTDDVSTRVSVLVKRKNNGAAIPTVLIRDGQKLMPPVIDLSGDPDGAGSSATYVWQRCSANCSTDGAWSDVGEASDSATEYEIQDGQAGYNFRLKVHYIDGQSYENVIFYNSGIRIRAKVFLENLLR